MIIPLCLPDAIAGWFYTDQDYSKGSVSHTNEEKNPWWLLDLGGVKDIAKIKVFNRGDCCGDRLQDANVAVIDASLTVIWEGKVTEAKDGSVTEFVAVEAVEEDE